LIHPSLFAANGDEVGFPCGIKITANTPEVGEARESLPVAYKEQVQRLYLPKFVVEVELVAVFPK